MRRRPTSLTAVVLAAALALVAGCDARSSTATTPTASDASAAASSDVALPAVSGGYGAAPVLTFPASSPPAGPATRVLSVGSGRALTAHDVIVADYLGQVWGGAVISSTFVSGPPLVRAIDNLVDGWASALTGTTVGSRVLLSLPPSADYGKDGAAVAGVSPTDTLVYVIDVIAAYGPDAAGQADAVPDEAAAQSAGPKVSGTLGSPAGLTLPAGITAPTAVVTTVLATGTGAAVHEGDLVAQYAGVDWSGESVGSSWQSGTPQVFPVVATEPTFAGLIGVPLGSRVLLQVPAGSGPAIAVVIDLVAQP